MLANCYLILAGGQEPPGAELYAYTLNSAQEFALICQMNPALLPPILHFLPLLPLAVEKFRLLRSYILLAKGLC